MELGERRFSDAVAEGGKKSFSDACVAAFAGWGTLALVNQVLLFRQTVPVSLSVRLAHRAYDAGQLFAAGFASWALLGIVERLASRRGSANAARWVRPLAVGVVVFIVSLLVVTPETARALQR